MTNVLNSSPVIRLDGVSKRYGRTLALDKVSLKINQQQMFALLGPHLAAVPDHFGIEAWAQNLQGLRIDVAEQVEIDKAVIQRRDQRVGAGRACNPRG